MTALILFSCFPTLWGQTSGKALIGSWEKVDFPQLELFRLNAKIDTGAYTSSIHCSSIKKTVFLGIPYVFFRTLDPSHPQYREKLLKMPIFKESKVKNSSGKVENRIFIKTPVRLAGEMFDIRLSLTNRIEMQAPVLIGRRALEGRFLVDPSRKNLKPPQGQP
ncbi:MAG: ATP-dependent zinc protease [SAR324 cluster bacterium]|nr:ATP-dependent zinc protease [SAR324 cluster bacterium]